MYTLDFSPSVYPITSWGYYILSGEWFESDDKHSDEQEQNKTEKKNFNSERELCRNANLLINNSSNGQIPIDTLELSIYHIHIYIF